MKQLRSIWLFAAAAILAAACTRVQVELPESEVSFQVASLRPDTKAVGDYTDIPFGAYAWFKGEDPADNTTFMTNQQVVFDATKNRWAPLGTTYYWPKSGSVDFICYSPYSAAGGPVVGENSIQYTGWDVSAQPTTDLLYADKASGQTDLFIRPPYRFKTVDAMFTNFHLPKSTLVILVRTFGGDELIKRAYEEAIAEDYRFYSYGDAMLIL